MRFIDNFKRMKTKDRARMELLLGYAEQIVGDISMLQADIKELKIDIQAFHAKIDLLIATNADFIKEARAKEIENFETKPTIQDMRY